MNRRGFFQMIGACAPVVAVAAVTESPSPKLPIVAPVATLIDSPITVSVSEFIHSSMRALGTLAPGDVLAAPEMESCRFTLALIHPFVNWKAESVTLTAGTARHLRYDLAAEMASEFGFGHYNRPRWLGWKIETVPPATSLLAEQIPEREYKALLEFYDGKQWEPKVEASRKKRGRPCLVINHLPAILAASIAADPDSHLALKPGRTHSRDQAEALIRLKAIVTRYNADAQRAYNYAASAMAERQGRMMSAGEFRYDEQTDVLSLAGTEYSGALFRSFGVRPSAPNELLKVVKVEDGMVTVRSVYDADLARRFDQVSSQWP